MGVGPSFWPWGCSNTMAVGMDTLAVTGRLGILEREANLVKNSQGARD